MARERRWLPWWIVGGVVALVVAWRILVLATAPALQPAAELQRAADALQAGDDGAATRHARAALAADPLDGRPYEVLAEVAAAEGDAASARALTALAVRHAPREPLARAMAAQYAVADADWPAAANDYDHLLRVTPSLSPNVFPALTAFAAEPASRAALVGCLVGDPPWRAAFLSVFAQTAPDPRPLFRELAQETSLSGPEASAYIGRFVAANRYADAFVAWLELLPPAKRDRLAMPVDGGFEPPLTGSPPFSWEIRQNIGVQASIRPRPDGHGQALRVQFLGRRSDFHDVRELLMLPPGDYRFAWRQKLDDLETARGLRWSLTCTGSPSQRIMTTEPQAGSSPWEDRSAAFRVPADCSAQWLVLELDARIPAETLAAGTAWFDDVRVSPAGNG